MKNNKKDLLHFLIWMRNGTSFCIAWFLILILIFNAINGIQQISTNTLIKFVILCFGGVFIFNLFFTNLFIKKWSFLTRLTCFMVSICLYECIGFYWFDIFKGAGSPKEWFLFIGIIFGLYLCCIAIYQRFSDKQGEIYTQSLQKYQEKRRMEHGK